MPSYGIVDSQSVKTVVAGEGIGIDGGKKVNGWKRHIVIDTLGNLLHVMVHAANVHDTKAAPELLACTTAKRWTIKAFSADAGYRGTTVQFVRQVLKRQCHISTWIMDLRFCPNAG
ncbi:transposase [Vogesella fluminis]|uniref:Transposase IS4-like domain-containing protein n=1 Tax=Vogesella fluminis TaxID=1069161 RepID=A0ABQ3H707_9NEIS|nr:transposase [Vogesella fluminis]GHD72713.1 hypothetical protein GCM10011419_06340 [Vogesella fluminis]